MAQTVTPYLIIPGVARFIEFARQALDAQEIGQRAAAPDGRIMHAEVRIGESVIMMGEPMGEWQPMAGSFYMYVPDVDAAYRRALDAGATSLREPADQFYGDRSGGVKDPCGNVWWLATHKEDVSHEELQRRMREAMRSGG